MENFEQNNFRGQNFVTRNNIGFLTSTRKASVFGTKISGWKHTHFEVRVEALMLKNVAADSDATALASIVLPFPGGPYSSRPTTRIEKLQIHSQGSSSGAYWLHFTTRQAAWCNFLLAVYSICELYVQFTTDEKPPIKWICAWVAPMPPRIILKPTTQV